MKKKLSVVILGVILLGSSAMAGEYNRSRRERRLPEYETYTHDRYIKYDRAGGRGNDGTIHFIRKTTVRRRYKDGSSSGGGRRNRCVDEKGRSKRCK